MGFSVVQWKNASAGRRSVLVFDDTAHEQILDPDGVVGEPLVEGREGVLPERVPGGFVVERP